MEKFSSSYDIFLTLSRPVTSKTINKLKMRGKITDKYLKVIIVSFRFAGFVQN